MAKKRVKMLVSIASPDWSYIPQQEVELDESLADAWIECGHAVPLETTKKGGGRGGSKANKQTDDGTSDAGGSKTVSED
jgi:hypothetical protein